jgi:uncharacterized membrane protein
MMDDYKNSDNFQRTEGCKMISPHHFHPTNRGSPADSMGIAKSIKRAHLIRFLLMCVAFTFFMVPWIKFRVGFGKGGDVLVIRLICDPLYCILALYISWVLCRTRSMASKFNQGISNFARKPSVAYVVSILSALVPLCYIIIAYLRWKRWCQ